MELDTHVSVLLGNGDGSLGNLKVYPAGYVSHSVALGDLNGDSHPDLVAPVFFGSVATILMGNGAGGFAAAPAFSISQAATQIAAADWSGDGSPDLVVGHGGNANISSILDGDGNGGFTNCGNPDHVPSDLARPWGLRRRRDD